MANLYLDESLTDVSPGATVELTGAEAKHAATVARTRTGEEVIVGNGAGLVVRGVVRAASAASVLIEVTDTTRTPVPEPKILLAQALAKGDRDELAVQAATELGVDGVIPWQAERSVSRWDAAKAAKGRERWAAIVREATKQSVRAWLPEVAPLVTTKGLVSLAAERRLVVLEPSAREPVSALRPDGRDIVLVVGPEGGISPPELDAFRAAGAEVVRLGASVLRTSTAGPAAIAVLNVALGRF